MAALRGTLSKTYRLSTSDGRTFEGVFICIDRERNMILQDALESSQQDPYTRREVGMVCDLVFSLPNRSGSRPHQRAELTSLPLGPGSCATDHDPLAMDRQG